MMSHLTFFRRGGKNMKVKNYVFLAIATFGMVGATVAGINLNNAVSEYQIAKATDELDGEGTEENPYLIRTKEDLYNFAFVVNGQYGKEQNKEACASLLSDIDLSPGQWMPLIEYSGTFNGNYHSITNILLNSSAVRTGFACTLTSDGKIQRLNLAGVINSYSDDANACTGGIVGYNLGLIYDCSSAITVTGVHNVGGIVGQNSRIIERCYNTGSISATGTGDSDGNAGGIAGKNFDGIYDCYNLGNVNSNKSYAGGIAGNNYGWHLERCFNTGSITATESTNLGGIAGYGTGSSIKNNYYREDTATKGLGNVADDNAKVKSLTADELKTESSFSSWDFTRIWHMGNDNPILVYGGVWVGDTYASCYTTSGEHWEYNYVTSTLTLNNYSFSGEAPVHPSGSYTYASVIQYDGDSWLYSGETLKIVLIGENSINITHPDNDWETSAINLRNSNHLSIVGEGSLSISVSGEVTGTSYSRGIEVAGNAIIDGPEIDISVTRYGDDDDCESYGLKLGSLTAKNGALRVNAATQGINFTGNISVAEDVELFEIVGSGECALHSSFSSSKLTIAYDGYGWEDASGTGEKTTITAGTHDVRNNLDVYKKISFTTIAPEPEPEPEPEPSSSSSEPPASSSAEPTTSSSAEISTSSTEPTSSSTEPTSSSQGSSSSAHEPETPIYDKDGVEVIVDGDYEVPSDVTIRIEVRAEVKEASSEVDYNKIKKQLNDSEYIAKVYDVKLIKTEGGVETEIQPSDLKDGLKLKVKITLPEDVSTKGLRVLHIHSADDIEVVEIESINGRELTFEVSRLSQFAFINVNETGFPGWAVALIVIGSLLLLCCGFFLVMFLVFPVYYVDYYKRQVRRAIFVHKHFNMVLMLNTHCQFVRRHEVDVFKSEDEAKAVLE